MGGAEILEQRASTAQDGDGIETNAEGMGEVSGYRGIGEGGSERVCEGVEGDWGEHVFDNGPGDYGGEGGGGAEDRRDAVV